MISFLLVLGMCGVLFINNKDFFKKMNLHVALCCVLTSHLMMYWDSYLSLTGKILQLHMISNFYWSFYMDQISLGFILLTSVLLILSFVYYFDLNMFNMKLFVLYIFLLVFLLMNFFMTDNLLMLYMLFESVLIPMGFIIGIWGSSQRKLHAFALFYMYTLMGSFFFLVAIMSIYSHCQSMDFSYIKNCNFSDARMQFMWCCLFMGFAVKMPMVPFHVWLPEAHTEAPTMGSVFLAALLLKLGSYGMLRFLYAFSSYISNFFMILMLIICLVGLIFISLMAMSQIDIKKIMAYSSMAHMSYMVAALANLTNLGYVGSVFLMLGHGFVSAALFFSMGMLYERMATRNMKYYGGLSKLMPKLTFFFLMFTLANVAFPGTSNFVGEFLILLSLMNLWQWGTFLFIMPPIMLCAVYSFWLYNSMFNGEIKAPVLVADLTLAETYILLMLFIYMLMFGICPALCINMPLAF